MDSSWLNNIFLYLIGCAFLCSLRCVEGARCQIHLFIFLMGCKTCSFSDTWKERDFRGICYQIVDFRFIIAFTALVASRLSIICILVVILLSGECAKKEEDKMQWTARKNKESFFSIKCTFFRTFICRSRGIKVQHCFQTIQRRLRHPVLLIRSLWKLSFHEYLIRQVHNLRPRPQLQVQSYGLPILYTLSMTISQNRHKSENPERPNVMPSKPPSSQMRLCKS